MSGWQIFSIIVGAIGTLFGAFGISAYFVERFKHKADKKNRQEDEDEERIRVAKQMELEETIGRVLDKKLEEKFAPFIQVIELFKSELTDIKDTINTVNIDIQSLKKGVQVTCRNDLEDLYDKAEKDGYCSKDDKNRFGATYDAYHNLGKNGVMDGKYAQVVKMSEHPKRKRTTKRKILLENKDNK